VEEHEARQKRPPGSRKAFSPEMKQKILEAFATWQGPMDEFCLKHSVHKVTLWEWRRKAQGSSPRPDRKTGKTQSTFTPEQRKQAVEAFLKSGQSMIAFCKAWGVREKNIGRWLKAYREQGPKSLAGRKGRKPGRKAVNPVLREEIKQLKAKFPDFGLRKVQGFLARFKGLKASHPTIRRVVKEKEGGGPAF
jgi:transposase-like protein